MLKLGRYPPKKSSRATLSSSNDNARDYHLKNKQTNKQQKTRQNKQQQFQTAAGLAQSGGRGFESRGWTNTHGPKITKK